MTIFWSKLPFLSQVWKATILDWENAFLFPTKTVKKQIEVDISIFLGYSGLYWHVLKHSCDFVSVSNFNFNFVRVLSKTLIGDYVVLSQEVMTYYVYLAEHIENDFLCFRKWPHEMFPPSPPMWIQNTYIKDKLLTSAVYTSMKHQNLCKSNRVCFNLALNWS